MNEITRISNSIQPQMLDPNYELIQSSGVTRYLQNIRPSWQSKNLIQRTIKILPIDPSSACQRIFNASIHDLREKVVVAGLDIAAATASTYRLPPIQSDEDILERYDTTKLINLAYRMGLLTRAEFRKISRVYDIRKDLEHEDDEYEAGVEDVVYVFKTCIDTILANDPVHIVKITDIKKIIETPKAASLDNSILEDYKSAPTPRQLEIYQMLISNSLSDTQADIIRFNSFNALGVLCNITHTQVILDAAKHFNDVRLDRRAPLQKEMRVAYNAGLLPYLRTAYKKNFFETFYERLDSISHHWSSHNKHGEILRDLIEVGGTEFIPQEIKIIILEWMIKCYIGSPGGYGIYGSNRKVFYSNSGAPLIKEILNSDESLTKSDIDNVVNSSNEIQNSIKNADINKRLQELLELLPD